jgi:hypothetical protein
MDPHIYYICSEFGPALFSSLSTLVQLTSPRLLAVVVIRLAIDPDSLALSAMSCPKLIPQI